MASLTTLSSTFSQMVEDALAAGGGSALSDPLASANKPVVPPTSVYSWAEALPPDPRDVAKRQAAQRPVVRRPTLGLVGYEDRFASLEVIVRGGNGEAIELFNSSYRTGRHSINTNFLVQRVEGSQAEAAQITRTFGDFYLADIGENPEVVRVQGALFEAKNFPWLSEWKQNYRKYLRARQCILRKAMVYLTIDDTMYVGYIMSTSNIRSADVAWEMVPFSFEMVLRNTMDLRAVSLFPDKADPATQGDTGRNQPATAQRYFPERLSLEDAARGSGPLSAVTTTEQEVGTGVFSLPTQDATAMLGEIVSGAFEGQTDSLSYPTLDFKGDTESAAFYVNAEETVRVARAINAAAGREIYNVGRVRADYMAGRMDEFQSMGLTNPEALARYGFPSRYQQEVDSRQQRVQEEYRATLESVFNRARDGVTSLGWL